MQYADRTARVEIAPVAALAAARAAARIDDNPITEI